MRKILFILLCFCAFSACRMDDRFTEDDFGMMVMDMSVDEDIKVVSRADAGSINTEELKKKSKIRIYKDGKLIDRYKTWDEMPADGILLPVGDGYSVFVVSGDSIVTVGDKKTAATFDWSNKFYKGTKEFIVNRSKKTEVIVESNVANTLVNVEFADGANQKWDDLLMEGNVNVSVDGGALDYKWKAETQQTGYYSLPYNNPVLRCVFTGKAKSGRSFRNEYILKNVKESTKYTLIYKPSEDGSIEGNEGGIVADIIISEEPLYTMEDEIKFYQRPVISAVDGEKTIDLTKDMAVETGATMSPVFTFTGSTPLSSVIMETELFKDFGIDASSVDLLKDKDLLISKGFGVEIISDKSVILRWNGLLNPYLAKEGIYNMRYVVTDTYNSVDNDAQAKVTEVNLRVISSNIITDVIPRFEVWATKATLYGKKLAGEDPTGKLYFRYKPKDSETWSESGNVELVSDTYKAVVTGLKPGTVYEYQMMNDDKPLGVALEFTTEEALQFPNAGFEEWDESGKVFYPNKSGASFWDSGNTGATTLGKDYNITTKDASVKNMGQYSAKLSSKKIITQFAAGNIFIGKYLETQMDFITGHGVLGLGRPFTSRPIALKGYIRYICGKVDNGGDMISKDSQDQGIIYMALTDDRDPAYEYGGEKWSFIIKTKDKQFFSKDNENVIAYGEKIWTESTAGEGMHEFVIRFNYDEKPDGKTRVPTRLMLVGAASRYGDYFQGSTGSTMWLDDLELIYDEGELSK